MRRGPFFVTVLLPALTMGIAAVVANAYIDPLWIMPKVGTRAGLHYCVQDERTNKLNRAIYGHLDAQGVLLGSSRSAFFDTRAFREPVFNMSVNGVMPIEFPELLAVFKQHVGTPRTVYVGVDFYGYLKEPGGEVFLPRLKAREEDSLRLFYRAKSLIDWSIFEYSIKTVTNCSSPDMKEPTYNYDGIRHVPRRPRDRDLTDDQMKVFSDQIYGKKPADPDYRGHLLALKAVSPDSKFVAYIPPITPELFKAIENTGHLHDYIDWLHVVVDVFGSVIQFSGKNAFTEDAANFYDLHHVYEDRTIPIVRIIDGQDAPSTDGFGRVLTRDNIDGERGGVDRGGGAAIGRW